MPVLFLRLQKPSSDRNDLGLIWIDIEIYNEQLLDLVSIYSYSITWKI